MRRHKFKNQLKNIPEIKATKVSNELKEHMLNNLSKLDLIIHGFVIDKRNNNFKVLVGNDSINKFYINLVSEFFSQISNETPIDLKLDKFVPNDCEKFFKQELLRNIKYDKVSDISFVSSERWKGIQFADLIAWSIFQFFENKNEMFLKRIKNNSILKIYKK